MQLGAKHVESPFIEFGQISTVFILLYFTVVMYGVTTIENTFVDLQISDKFGIKNLRFLLYPYNSRSYPVGQITYSK
jgi:hypothetical protein